MAKRFEITVEKHRMGSTSKNTTEGTIQELTKYFSYTLECGNIYNSKINRTPKTIKSLISNLEKTYDEKHETVTLSYKEVQ